MISVKNNNFKMCKMLIDNGAFPSINTPNNVNIIYVNMYLLYILPFSLYIANLFKFLIYDEVII
jgi:hypothetical protein